MNSSAVVFKLRITLTSHIFKLPVSVNKSINLSICGFDSSQTFFKTLTIRSCKSQTDWLPSKTLASVVTSL